MLSNNVRHQPSTQSWLMLTMNGPEKPSILGGGAGGATTGEWIKKSGVPLAAYESPALWRTTALADYTKNEYRENLLLSQTPKPLHAGTVMIGD